MDFSNSPALFGILPLRDPFRAAGAGLELAQCGHILVLRIEPQAVEVHPDDDGVTVGVQGEGARQFLPPDVFRGQEFL